MLLFGHDALVFLIRYLVEGLTEDELMALTRQHVIANCSVTGWSADADGRLTPDVFNDVAPPARSRAPGRPGRTRSMPNRSDTRVITPALLRDWALPVPTGGKESRGTVLVVGGSRFTPGAVLLAGVAALRAGAGVLQLAAAESTAAALSIQVPEAMVVGLPETADGAVAG